MKILLILIFLVSFSSQSRACTCWLTQDKADENFQNADVIAEVKIIDLETYKLKPVNHTNPPPAFISNAKVLKYIKSSLFSKPEEIKIIQPRGACNSDALELQETGTVVLKYNDEEKAYIRAGLCASMLKGNIK